MPKKSAKQNPSKVKRIIIAIVALAVFGLIIFGIVLAIKESTTPDFDDGSELSVIELTTNGGVAYEWNYKIEDETIAKITDKTSSARDNLEGGVVDLNYIVKGLKPGTTKIVFKYGSFISGEVEEERTYKIEVNRKLETKITEEK